MIRASRCNAEVIVMIQSEMPKWKAYAGVGIGRVDLSTPWNRPKEGEWLEVRRNTCMCTYILTCLGNPIHSQAIVPKAVDCQLLPVKFKLAEPAASTSMLSQTIGFAHELEIINGDRRSHEPQRFPSAAEGASAKCRQRQDRSRFSACFPLKNVNSCQEPAPPHVEGYEKNEMT